MSKTGKTAAMLAAAAGIIFFIIPLFDKCLGWFGCAFRPWVLSAAIVVPTELFLAAIVVVSCNVIVKTVYKAEGISTGVKTIQTFVLLLITGFLCLGIGWVGMIVFGISYTPESVVERNGQKMVRVDRSFLDVDVVYHAYKNAFIMSENVLLHEGFSSKALDSISSKNDPMLTKTTEFAR